jgi:DNA repair exonuclease SbcCD ATPase subunit
MKLAVLVLCCVSSCALSSHPIENVITLLEGLSAKTEAEGKSEALTFEKFEYWCHNSKKTLNNAIAEEKTTIDELKSKISADEEDEESLKDQIKKLQAELAALDSAGIKAKDVREEGASLYAEANSDYKDTIAAVQEALTVLEKARDDTEAASLLQKALPFVEAAATEAQRQTLEAFLQEEPLKAEGDRAAHVDKYASKSHTVIELLNELVQKFQAEKLAADKAETNALNSYDLAKQARDAAVAAAELSKEKKSSSLEETQKELKASRAKLSETQGDLEADSASLSDTDSSCAKKKREWEERSATRKGELEAMAMAVKILSKATGVRTSPPSNPVPPPSPIESFFQISAAGSPKSARALALLRAASEKANAGVLRSRALERLAQEISAHLAGPFDKVNNMIENDIPADGRAER